MKGREGISLEDILMRVSSPKTPDNELLSLYRHLAGVNLNNAQRSKALKAALLHCKKDGSSSELCDAALKLGLSIVCSELKPGGCAAVGVVFYFLEVCRDFVSANASKENTHLVETVSRAFEVLSHINILTLKKLFPDKSGAVFVKVLTYGLKTSNLQVHALKLLDQGLTLSESEVIGKALTEAKTEIFEMVYPLLFCAGSEEIQSSALNTLKKLNISDKPPLLWQKLKEDTQKIYCKSMVDMVVKKQKWPDVWQFVVTLFCDELRSGGQLINNMLEVLERAFKHTDLDWTRVQAFLCWNTLIDNFKSGLKNKKRLELIMIPMKANNHRTETLASAKLQTYSHLLQTLSNDLPSTPEILTSFFSFCFGSEKTSILPVRSYPSLHGSCAALVKELLSSSYSEELFMKSHLELMSAVGNCFLMEKVSSNLLGSMWDNLLELVKKQPVTEKLKNLLYTVNSLVARAEHGDVSKGFQICRNVSPTKSKSSTSKPNETLGKNIVAIILLKMTCEKSALSHSILKSRSLYIGSYDVMTGTLASLVAEWLLSPALMLGAGNTGAYKQILSLMVTLHREESTGFMDFCQLLLKKLPVIDEVFAVKEKVMCYGYVTDVWCCLAENLVSYIQSQGEINQGDAAEHDFQGLYMMMLFPVNNLFVEFPLIEKCSKVWQTLLYEACKQADLVPTSSSRELCEQVCVRLAAVSKRNNSFKQQAAIYHFLACVLKVASGKFKSNSKWCSSLQQLVSGILKELDDLTVNEELVFSEVILCIIACFQHKSSLAYVKVIENISTILCSLLKCNVNSPSCIEKLCTLLDVLKQSIVFIRQHEESLEKGIMTKICSLSRSHPSQKVLAAVKELQQALEGKQASEKEENSVMLMSGSSLVGSAYSPSSRLVCSSPVTASKTSPSVVKTTPSKSPKQSAKKLELISLCSSKDKFVRIETPPKKIVLTEHQKEVRKNRRSDIPALYQDLSQDTQSMSQDSSQSFVALPPTIKGKVKEALDEDAVMDFSELLNEKTFKSPKSSEKKSSTFVTKGDFESFKPPAGFVLLSSSEADEKNNDVCNKSNFQTDEQNLLAEPEKENEDGSLSMKIKNIKNSPRGAVTRSSSGGIRTTRSGNKQKRISLTLVENERHKKRKYVRKSLPSSLSEDQVKENSNDVILIESDTTDTESVSSFASDLSTSGMKPTETSAPNKKSRLKKNNSLDDSLSDFSSEEKVMETPKLSNCLKDDKDKRAAVGHSDEPENILNRGIASTKPTGGKTLTRSSSNSSLCEIVNPEEKLRNPLDVGLTLNAPQKNSDDIGNQKKTENEVEESQEIIESSQPLMDIVRPCAVSLEPFVVAEPNEEVTIENMVLVKGPAVTSPYKIQGQNADKDLKRGAQKSACRSLKMEEEVGFDSPSSKICLQVSESGTPLITKVKKESPTSKSMSESVLGGMELSRKSVICDRNGDSLPKVSVSGNVLNGDCEDSKDIKVKLNDEFVIKDSEDLSLINNDSRPEWMHEKKTSPPNKARRPYRGPCARSQAFMKSFGDVDFTTSPPKGGDMSPISSPSQSKKALKVIVDTNSTPLSKQSSRAVKLLGLGQAAAARGGETVVSNTALSARADLGNDSSDEKGELTQQINLASCTGSMSNTNLNANSTSGTVNSTVSTIFSSPSVQKTGRKFDLDSLKPSPQKCLEDEECETDLHVKDPHPQIGILKRKRIHDADSSSPRTKKKRVSFSDPIEMSSHTYTEFSDMPDAPSYSDRLKDPDCQNESNPKSGKKKNSDVECESTEGQSNQESTLTLKSISNDVPLMSKEKHDKEEQTKDSGEGNRNANLSHSMKDSKTKSKNLVDACNNTGRPKRKRKSLFDRPNGEELDVPQVEQKKVENVLPVNEKEQTKANSWEVENQEESLLECNDPMDIGTLEETSISEFGVGIHEKSMEENSEVADTQGQLDDLHRWLSPSSPIYPSLVQCKHSIKLVISKLTTSTWEESLMQQCEERNICSVGDLAVITEENLDRLTVKEPKMKTVKLALDDFAKGHSSLGDHMKCGLPNNPAYPSGKCIETIEDVLANTPVEDVVSAITNLTRGRKDILPNILQSVPLDLIAETYLSKVDQSSGEAEKKITAEQLTAILCRIPDEIIQSTIKPSPPSLFSHVLAEAMCGSVLQQRSASEIIEELDKQNRDDIKSQLLQELLSRLDSPDIVDLISLSKYNDIFEALLDNVTVSSKFFKLMLSKINPSDFPKLDKSSFAKLVECLKSSKLDQTKSDELVKVLLNNSRDPSKHLMDVMSSKMTATDLARLVNMNHVEIIPHLDPSKADEIMKDLLLTMKRRPSEALLQAMFAKMTPTVIANHLNFHKKDLAQQFDQTQSEALIMTLLNNIKRQPSQELTEEMLLKMTPSAIASHLDMRQTDIALQLDHAQTEQLIQTLLQTIKKKPSTALVEAMVSKIPPSSFAEQINLRLTDTLQQLDQNKSEDLVKVLLSNIRKPSEALLSVMSSKMSPTSIADQLSHRQSDFAHLLDQNTSEGLIHTLLSNCQSPTSEEIVQVVLSKASPSSIAKHFTDTKSGEVIEALLKKIDKPSKSLLEAFLSKINASDLVKNGAFRLFDVLAALEPKVLFDVISDYMKVYASRLPMK